MKKRMFLSMILLFSLVLSAQEPAQAEPKAEEPKVAEEKAEEPKADVETAEEPKAEEEKAEEPEAEDRVEVLTKQMNELAESIKKRDAEMELLKSELSNMKAKMEAPEVKENVAEKVQPPEKKEEAPIVKFKPYGSIELAGYGSDAQFMSNDLMLYVEDEKGSTSNITARNTRFGVDISLPRLVEVDLVAKIELDFFGGLANSGLAESNVGLRIRHAYLKIGKTFKSGTTLSFLAGQTWSTATVPIFPSMINPAQGWGAGNVWSRLPLAEFEVAQKAGPTDIGLKLAVAKPITGASANKGGFLEMNIDAGDASHWPSLQGQLYVKAKFSGIDLMWAAAGAYGRENYVKGVKINNAPEPVYGDEVEVWIFDTALNLSHKYAEIQAKYFMGANLDMFGFFGGSIITDKGGYVVESMKGMGYWVELALKPYKGLKLAVGLGGEYTNHDQAVYDQNDSVWVSVFWTFFDHLTPGFQWQQIITEKNDIKKTGNVFLGNLKFTF